jgi:hypothetical protein
MRELLAVRYQLAISKEREIKKSNIKKSNIRHPRSYICDLPSDILHPLSAIRDPTWAAVRSLPGTFA